MKTSPPLAFLADLRPAFVAHLAGRLDDVICTETQAYADALGIRAPVKTHSALLFLMRCGPATLTEIARTDGQSHQLLAARLGPLEGLGLIERVADPKDGRRRPYRLTRTGQSEARRVEQAVRSEAAAMKTLFAELGIDLIDVLERAIESLRVRPLSDRIEAASPSAGRFGKLRTKEGRRG